MNKIRDTTLVPQGGGFIYIDPDSGVLFKHCTVEHLIVLAKKHREANNYSALSIQDIIDNICASTPGNICFDEPPPSAGQRVISVMKALYESARSGFATLTVEELEQRRTVCETSGIGGGPCEYYKGIKGVFDVMCGKCGCTKLKIHLKSSKCPKKLWPI